MCWPLPPTSWSSDPISYDARFILHVNITPQLAGHWNVVRCCSGAIDTVTDPIKLYTPKLSIFNFSEICSRTYVTRNIDQLQPGKEMFTFLLILGISLWRASMAAFFWLTVWCFSQGSYSCLVIRTVHFLCSF